MIPHLMVVDVRRCGLDCVEHHVGWERGHGDLRGEAWGRRASALYVMQGGSVLISLVDEAIRLTFSTTCLTISSIQPAMSDACIYVMRNENCRARMQPVGGKAGLPIRALVTQVALLKPGRVSDRERERSNSFGWLMG